MMWDGTRKWHKLTHQPGISPLVVSDVSFELLGRQGVMDFGGVGQVMVFIGLPISLEYLLQCSCIDPWIRFLKFLTFHSSCYCHLIINIPSLQQLETTAINQGIKIFFWFFFFFTLLFLSSIFHFFQHLCLLRSAVGKTHDLRSGL